jgi:hypothetical protein
MEPAITVAVLLGILWVLTQTEFGRKVFAIIGLLAFASLVLLGVATIRQEVQFSAAVAETAKPTPRAPPGETREQMLKRCAQYDHDVVDMIIHACKE